MTDLTPRRWIAVIAALAIVLGACAGPSPSTLPSPSAVPSPSSPGSPSTAPTPNSSPNPSPTSIPTPTAAATPTSPSSPTPIDVTVSLEPFATGVPGVFLADPADGEDLLYVVGQSGVITTVAPDGSHDGPPFLDITERIVDGGERGLLGLAFHPGYPQDPRFYVMYTAAGDGANTVSEFTATDGVADPGSERILLSIDDFAPNHNGGMVAFGADGFLYIGTGDGGGGGDPNGNGQNPDALLGKILRIDVDRGRPYAIPTTNPSEGGMAVAREIWDLGMRNPWRFSFDRQTGDLWIGDVGQGEWEEIDAEPAGQGGRNYGWNTMEAQTCFVADDCDQTGLTLPVASYDHRAGGCAVIGGYVYRGEAFPDAHGTYIFADYCTGQFWALDAAAAMAQGHADPVEVAAHRMTVAGFGEDEHGELYMLDLSGNILRLVFGIGS